MPFSLPQNVGSYVPTTQVWDTSQIVQSNLQPELKELLIRMYQNLGFMSDVLNTKTSGKYPTMEFVISSQYFPNPTYSSATGVVPADRQVFRSTYNVGTIGAGVTNVPHGLTINNSWTFTHIYGTANDTVGFNYYPIPFASAGGAANIELRVTNVNIVITNNSGVAFTNVYIVLEYLKT